MKEKQFDEIKKHLKLYCFNKLIILVITIGVLFLSFKLIEFGITNSKDYSPIIGNVTVTDFVNRQGDVQKSDSITYPLRNSVPIKMTQEDYTITLCILMFICILVVVSLSLWGVFTALFKVLKSEHEINSILIDVQKDIYKEKEMWELVKEKKKYENEQLQNKIDEFEKLEKMKLELKHKHELESKDSERRARNIKLV